MHKRSTLLRLGARRFGHAGKMEAHFAEFVAARKQKLATQKAFQHPTDDPDRPVVFSPGHDLFMFQQMFGPEQVSTHYESFAVSRRFALSGIGTIAALTYLAKITDLNWVLRSVVAGMPVWFALAIMILEVPKYQFLPLLNSFYVLTFNNELRMMQDAVPDEVQALVDRNMKEALGQFDFLLLHSKFNAVKQESVRAFLRNQELELKQGVRERAADLLKMAEDYESSNQKQVVARIIASIDEEVAALLAHPPKDVVDAAFDAALTGIKEGRMTYKGDKALEHVLKRVRAETAKFKAMTPEQ